MSQFETSTEASKTDTLGFCIDSERPLCNGKPVWRWNGGDCGASFGVTFSNIDGAIREEVIWAIEDFKKVLLEIICRHRYLKLQKKLETNIEHISEEMTEKERTREYNMPLYELYALSEYVDFSKLPDEETPSEVQEAAGEANAISKEEFEELMQKSMKKRHRVTFTTDAASDKEQSKGSGQDGELVSALQGIKEVLERMEGMLSAATLDPGMAVNCRLSQEKFDQMLQDYKKRKKRKTYAGGTGGGAPGPSISIPCPPKQLGT